jgi:hypothetical protein
MTDDHSTIKVGTVWFGVYLGKLGIHTWSDLAAIVATVYTLILIADWAWRVLKRK